MSDEWIVRVEGKEYGPVDLDALREWRSEGRLIPSNELRLIGTDHWILAGDLPEVFAEPPETTPPPLPRDFETPKRWGQIASETFRTYRAGFVPFMFFGLLTAVPMFVAQWTLPKIPMPDLVSGLPESAAVPPLSPICVAMLVLLLLIWPVSTAGFQITADGILRGQPLPLGAQISAAIRCWMRVLTTAIFVYGSYFFWIFVPLAAMLAPVNTGNQLLILVVVMLVGAFMIYMNGRLFINFLFWHQTTVLEEHPPLAALAESKDLARSAPEALPFDRPLYRGATIASVWFLIIIVMTFGIHLAFMMARVAGIPDPEQAVEVARKAALSETPDALMIAANVIVAVVNLLLRPVLAVAFVVLYYDARARSGNRRSNLITRDIEGGR